MGVRSGITIAFQDEDIVDVGSVALDEITSDAGTTVKVTLGNDSGDDFKVDETSLVVQGDTGNVGVGTATPRRVVDVVDASNPQLRLSHTDDTEYVELQSLSTGDAVVKMTDSTLHLRSGDSHSFLQIQNTTTGQADGTSQGFTVGVNGNDAYLFNRAGTGSLYIGSSGITAITVDASENATFVANLAASGSVTLGDAGADAHTLNGTLQFAQEVASPSAPASGAGGIIYVKDDGIPYFISDTTAETALTGGGGGGGYTVESKSSGFTAVIEYFYIVTGTSGAITVNLPSASTAGSSGKKIGFKFMDAGDHTVTLSRNGTDKIDEIAVDLEINAQSSLELISDGSHWFVV
tara:strand:- start:1743 stop:2792 length:1050 start_codon:yes stop_codon:yes gene_type:complete